MRAKGSDLMFAIRNLGVIAALKNATLTTAVFPAVIATACTLLVVMSRTAGTRLRVDAGEE